MTNTFTTTVDVRFRDLDAMGHVNHAVYASYLESARNDLFFEALNVPLDAVNTVLAHLSVDYKNQIRIDDDVTIELWVADVGRSSLTIEYEVYANDTLSATATSVQVLMDDDLETTVVIPDDWKRSFAPWRADATGAD